MTMWLLADSYYTTAYTAEKCSIRLEILIAGTYSYGYGYD